MTSPLHIPRRAPTVVALRRVTTVLVCGMVPAYLLYSATIGQAVRPRPDRWHYAIDFHHVWLAARDFVNRQSPYPPPEMLLSDRWTADHVFAYPPPLAAVLGPLGLMPYPVAAGLFTVLALAAVFGALRLLGVRDWRCYGLAFAAPAVMTAVSVGTLTPVLALAVAATWRYRDSWPRCAAWLALAVTAKLFLWPLAVWLWVTGRRRAAAAGIALAGFATLAAWAVLGFRGISDYPALLQNLAAVQSPHSYSVARFTGPGMTLTALTVASVLLAAGVTRRKPGAEAETFAVMVLMSIAFSPIAWLHYFALGVVLIALWSRQLGGAWLLPLVLWLTPWQQAQDDWRSLLAFATVAGSVALAARGAARMRVRGGFAVPSVPAPAARSAATE